MAPGPAISGVASGNTETSSLSSASLVSSSVVLVEPDGSANTSLMPISKSRMPPAVRSAGRVIPM